MNLDFLLLPIGILCLWTPSSLMASAKIKAKLRQGNRRSREGLSALLRCRLNWIDLARSYFGAWLLVRFVDSFHNLDSDIRWIPLAAQITVLAVGCLAQVIWFDRKVSVIGPLFYLSGLTMAVCGPLVGGFGLLLSINCALMFRRLGCCFLFAPASLVLFAVAFRHFGIVPLVNAGLFALPLILAFATGSRLAFVRSPRTERTKKVLRRAPTAGRVFDGDTYIPTKEMVGAGSESPFGLGSSGATPHKREFRLAATLKR